MLRRLRSNYANVAASLALIAALGGSAIAATADKSQSTGQLYACAAKKGKKKGLLRSVTKPKCKKRERLVAWNAQGPAGADGAAGKAGTAGVAGVAGAGGQSGPTGPTGPAGTTSTEDSTPEGAVMAFNLASCPAGWDAYAPAEGRVVVGLPSDGTLGATVGTALGPQENRATGTHDHALTDPGHVHPIETDPILSGGNVTPTRVTGTANEQPDTIRVTLPGAAQSATTGITLASAGAVAGTNAPYVQLLVCEKS